MRVVKRIMILSAALFLFTGLCACGKATMQINDGGVVTELEVPVPRTVQKILEDAEIALKEGDEVSLAGEDTSLALDTKISEAQEIIISRKNTVSLTVDGETKEVVMVGGTVSDLLNQEGITLDEKQHVNYEMDEYLKDGMDVRISYVYEVEVQCDGKTLSQETESMTVGDVLKELEITVGKDDRVVPAETDPVTDGMKIVVSRVTFDTLVETETVDYETAYEDDATIAKGNEQVAAEGENGEKEVTYKVTYVDGTEESREKTGEKITKEPVNKIVKVGTKEEPSPGSTGAPAGGSGKTVVSKKAYNDCDDPSHGYYEIVYSDGTVEYEEF